MDISNIKNNLITYINLAITDDDNEFEARFLSRNNKITSEKFNNIISYLLNDKSDNGNKKYTLISNNLNNVSLDITLNNDIFLSQTLEKIKHYRLSINDDNEIKSYCKRNKYNKNNIMYGEKKRIDKYKPLDLLEHNIRFNVSLDRILNEKNTDNLEEIKENINKNIIKADKKFRYKKRITFLTDSKLFKIDLTLVKSGKSKFFYNSGILNSNPKYEIEIELNHDEIKSQKIHKKKQSDLDKFIEDNLVKELINIIENITLVLNDEKYIITNTEKFNVLKNYINLIFVKNNESTSNKIRYSKILRDDNIEYFKNNSYRFFVGPKPVTLEISNFFEKNRNSILENYTVTDKADGERYLLYINTDNKVYLIDNNLNVKYTGLKNKNKDTLIDGELITKDKYDQNIYSYYIFDIYFKNGDIVYNKKLIDNTKKSRYELFNEVVKDFEYTDKSIIKIESKIFYSKSIKNDCKKILDTNIFQYKIDGLIFTPANLSAGGTNEDDEGTIMGSWSKTFKWKPPEQSTIDFLVEFQGKQNVESNGITKPYMYCLLYVGYKVVVPTKKDDNDVNVIDVYKILKKDFSDNLYGRKQLFDCYLYINENNRILTSDNKDIKDKMIVEFYYDDDKNIEEERLKWKPYRIRYDKTNPNDFVSAQNVWNTILNPVTKEILFGDKKITKNMTTRYMLENETYYETEIDRNLSLTKTLRNFHNIWVKNKFLYNRFKGVQYLYDIACGRGGDLHKWINAGYETVVGSDINYDNLFNIDDGIYKRYTESIRKKEITKQKMLFLQLDATQKWNKEYRNTINNEDLRKFSKVVFGDINKIDIEETELYPFYNLINVKFNLVSCMFAIHYMFENENTLDNFVHNIDLVLKNNGIFIGTCLDGSSVNNKLINKDIINAKSNNTLLWQIEKLYDNYDEKKPFNNIGKKIKVYMESINKFHDEYLVDYNLLEQKLKSRNILPLNDDDLRNYDLNTSSGSFQMIYDYYTNEKNEKIKLDLQNKEYSFLNRWFIFKKYIKE